MFVLLNRCERECVVPDSRALQCRMRRLSSRLATILHDLLRARPSQSRDTEAYR